MQLIFLFFGSLHPSFSMIQNQNYEGHVFWFSWILQITWVVLMLAVLASFVLGTIAPFDLGRLDRFVSSPYFHLGYETIDSSNELPINDLLTRKKVFSFAFVFSFGFGS